MADKPSPRRLLSEFLLLTLGACLVSAGVYFFKFPNHFSMGGVSGLAVLLGAVVPSLSPAAVNSIISVIFLILGFFLLDKGFGAKTVYCSLVYSGSIQLLEWLCPISGTLTSNRMLEAFFAVLLPALGAGILFNLNSSTGGTDIAAMILKKFSGMDAGRALLCSDLLIAAAALWIFDIETGLFSLLGLVLKSVMVDTVIESINRRKQLSIITSHPEIACDYITKVLGRGATVWEGQGAYTHQTHWVVLTVLSGSQAVLLRRHLREEDPGAFFLASNSSEIFGKGFLRA